MLARHLLPWFVSAVLPAQIALADLPKVARERAERARPAQEKALEPFWADLALDYRTSQKFLDGRIAQAAALGDSVVPILLEKLQPTQSGESARNLAANSRRVLEQLDPATFVDQLTELANGRSETARVEAIQLLGHANSPQAVQVLVDLADRSQGEDRHLVLRSLRLLKATSAAGRLVGLLGSSDRRVREDVLNYLIAARPAQVADTVAQALSTEQDTRLLPAYIEYFANSVREHDLAARTLLTLIGERLDWQDTRRLVQALGTIAPREHAPTCQKLHEMLETGETSALAVQAAVTLRNLGDRQGVTKLKRTLDEQLRKPARRREAALYEQRANLAFATEEYVDAIADFEKILEFSDGHAMTRRANIGLIRCEAHRKKWQNLTKLLKSSGMTVSEIGALAVDDATMQEALANEKVKSFLVALAKEQSPK